MPGETILVVGAGFAGAVHARVLAESFYHVEVIDRRPHIAGNAYDETAPCGTRLHRYGPHLLHTGMAEVVTWLRRFTAFVPYEHRVEALLPGGATVPLPINRRTINTVFGAALASAAEVRGFLARLAVPLPPGVTAPRNAAEHLASQIGTTLTDLFFRPYTGKMWGCALEEMDAAVVKRIPLRYDDEDRYFPDDAYQMLPRDGYTALVAAMLDHPRIRVTLGTPFHPSLRAGTIHCFNSMAIDECYGEKFGALPYRSLRFHHRQEPTTYGCGTAPVVNFTDDSPHTRQTDWSRLPGHAHLPCPADAGGTKTVTVEEPCDAAANQAHGHGPERYYPVRTSDGRNDALYKQYCALARQDPGMTFIGRCGTYRYLDMHQVINQSLRSAAGWIAGHRIAA